MALATLRSKLLILALAPVLILVLFLVLYLHFSRSQDQQHYIEQRGRAVANQLAGLSVLVMDSNNQSMLQSLAFTALEEQGVRAISIYDDKQSLLAHAGPKIDLADTVLEQAGKYQELPEQQIYRFIQPVSLQPYIYQLQEQAPLNYSTVNRGWVIVDFSQHAFLLQRYEQQMLRNGLLFLCLLIALFVAIYVSRRVSKEFLWLENCILSLDDNHSALGMTDFRIAEIRNLWRGIDAQVSALRKEYEAMQQSVELTNRDLNASIESLEIQNIELGLARKEALAASKLKSEFLANTSHEVRTPLNSIIGFSKILGRTPLSQQQQEYLENIRQSSEGLMIVINDILDFSKIEAGKLELDIAPFNLRQIIEEVVSLFAPMAYDKKLELTYIIYQDVPLNLKGDAIRLKQIISNLVSNAIKFTDAGQVVVRVDLDPAVEMDGTAALQISVADTGVGLSLEQQQKLFRAFSQPIQKMYAQQGTGLGLIIAKRLSELMKGDITVESDEDQGATFCLSLGLEISSNRFDDIYQSLNGLSVLLKTHNAITASSMKSVMEAWHCHVLIADNEKAVRDQLRQHHVDAIIVDINPINPLQKQIALAEAWVHEFDLQVFIMRPGSFEHLQQPMSDSLIAIHKPFTEPGLYRALSLIGLDAAASNNTREEHSEYEGDFEGKAILVVDDTPSNAELMRTLLEDDFGCDVTIAEDGLQAVSAVKTQKFDLIFMDIRMPNMNGIEASEWIRQHENSNQYTPIIALTAHAMADEKRLILQSGMNDYLTKPINVSVLYDCLLHYMAIVEKAVDKNVSDARQHNEMLVDVTMCLQLAKGKKEVAIRMLELLLDEVPVMYELLEQYYEQDDKDNLLDLVHKLHGACCYVGVPVLKAQVEQLEKTIKQGVLSLSNISHEITQLIAALKVLMDWQQRQDIPALFD